MSFPNAAADRRVGDRKYETFFAGNVSQGFGHDFFYLGGRAAGANCAASGAMTTWFVMRHAEIAAFDRRLTTDAQEFFRDVEHFEGSPNEQRAGVQGDLSAPVTA